MAAPGAPTARANQRGDDQSGSATVELVLAVPVLWLCLMLIVQFGLWSHASHVAAAAAAEGARAARVETGSAGDGQARAEDFLVRAGGSVLLDTVVSACRTDDAAGVEVRGRSVTVVPGMVLAVSANSAGPVERFRTEDDPLGASAC